MGNNKSKPPPITNYEYELDKKSRIRDLVDEENDKIFSTNFVKKKGSFQKTRIQMYIGKDVWFYDFLNFPGRYSSNNFKVGVVESFDDTALTADIRVGYQDYRVPLWKIFIKVKAEPPTKKEWNMRLEDVGDSTAGMGVWGPDYYTAGIYQLKF